MIGRIYRPNKIKLKKGKLSIDTTMKSNMGGKKELKIDISLIYDNLNKSEVLVFEILNADLGLAVLKEKNSLIDEQKCIDVKWENIYYKVPPLRKILKPANQNNTDTLNRGYVIIDGRCIKINIAIDSINDKYKDLVVIKIYPIVIDNIEYLFIDSESNTPIIKCGSNVLLISKKDSKEDEIYEGIN